MDCYSCLALSGEKRISPGSVIAEGTYWIVEHAYPTSIRAWLVIVLKRHAEALHELNQEEFTELAQIQYRLAQIMGQDAQTEKEYTMCFAEAEHFHHIHFHFVAKPKDLPAEAKGPCVFSQLNVDKQHTLSVEEIIAICEDFKLKYQAFK
jgi:diadenosine tetraphosphate (Ap4A) HIT family hydrolase